MGFLTWIVVGLIAGWLAGQVMKGGGYGILVDIILGILGGLVGGWLFGLLGIRHGGGMIGSIIVAFIGAVILVWITRLLNKAWTGILTSEKSRCDAVIGNWFLRAHTQRVKERLPLSSPPFPRYNRITRHACRHRRSCREGGDPVRYGVR